MRLFLRVDFGQIPCKPGNLDSGVKTSRGQHMQKTIKSKQTRIVTNEARKPRLG